ncbi:MAG: hypothetical protein JO133_09085 [Burkholderiaceae bacterium]|nr:hypothetical protein [Burkholderiaceae bacterium]
MKKRSAASSGASPEAPVVIFVDRSVGRLYVPRALRAAGATVITHDERFPEENTPDAVWLAEAGASGWVVVTRDSAIRHKPNEWQALMEHGVLAVVVTARNVTGPRIADLLVHALPRILEIAQTTARPAIFRLNSSGKPEPMELGARPQAGSRVRRQ